MTSKPSSRGGIKAVVATPWRTLIVLALLSAAGVHAATSQWKPEQAERDHAAEKAFLTEIGLAKTK